MNWKKVHKKVRDETMIELNLLRSDADIKLKFHELD